MTGMVYELTFMWLSEPMSYRKECSMADWMGVGTVMSPSVLPSLACLYLLWICPCQSSFSSDGLGLVCWFVLVWGIASFFCFSQVADRKQGLGRGKTGSMMLRKWLLFCCVYALKFMPSGPFLHHPGPPSAVSHEDDAGFRLNRATQQRYQDELATNHILTIL